MPLIKLAATAPLITAEPAHRSSDNPPGPSHQVAAPRVALFSECIDRGCILGLYASALRYEVYATSDGCTWPQRDVKQNYLNS